MPKPLRRESHLFAAFAVLALPVILRLLPDRYRLLPSAVPFVLAAGLALPMLAAGVAPTNAGVVKVERYAAWVVLPFVLCLKTALLAILLKDMSEPHSEIRGMTLLTTSIGIWLTNVLVFALAYWQLDRGGPVGRIVGWSGRADFTFTRGDPSDGVPADWQPGFADYLALAFNTSTAFSPTDVMPLTARAKMMMVVQSSFSLVTVVAVAARAINILGSPT